MLENQAVLKQQISPANTTLHDVEFSDTFRWIRWCFATNATTPKGEAMKHSWECSEACRKMHRCMPAKESMHAVEFGDARRRMSRCVPETAAIYAGDCGDACRRLPRRLAANAAMHGSEYSDACWRSTREGTWCTAVWHVRGGRTGSSRNPRRLAPAQTFLKALLWHFTDMLWKNKFSFSGLLK
jgi:hypothetical protein